MGLFLDQECGEERHRWDVKALELLKAMGKMGGGRRMKKQPTVQEEEDPEKQAAPAASAAPSELISHFIWREVSRKNRHFSEWTA